MRRMAGPLCVLCCALGCLDRTAYGPAGYHCGVAADCPSGTTCFRERCEVLSARPVRPTAANTGVPPDRSLTLSGPLVIETEGTVLDGLDVGGCLQIKANHVTVRNSRITCASYFAIDASFGAEDLLVEDVEIDGQGFSDSHALAGGALIARRLDIHGVLRGATLGSHSRLEGSYLHDFVDAKPLGVEVNGGTDITATGNAVDLAPNTRGWAVFMNGGTSALSASAVTQNWLNGGSDTVAAGGGGFGSGGVEVHHNRFGRLFADAALSLGSGAVQYENVYDDNGAPVSP